MKKKMIIVGAGGHGKVCSTIAKRIKKYDEILFYDEFKSGKVNSIEILEEKKITKLINFDTEFIIAIGDNNIRERISIELINNGGKIGTIIDPSAIVDVSAKIGNGVVVFPNAVINTGVVISDGVIINTMAIVEHDCYIGSYGHVSPGAVLLGGVSCGCKTWIGANATIIQNRKIGNDAIIGAGSVVTKDIEPNVVAVGIPARAIKQRGV